MRLNKKFIGRSVVNNVFFCEAKKHFLQHFLVILRFLGLSSLA